MKVRTHSTTDEDAHLVLGVNDCAVYLEILSSEHLKLKLKGASLTSR